MIIELKSEKDTEKLAQKIVKKAKLGDIFCLNGDLGTGKTFFSRAFIRASLKDKNLEIPSPTFTLVQSYVGKKVDLYHYDFYRLKDMSELYELGLEDHVNSSVTLIEWPQIGSKFLSDLSNHIYELKFFIEGNKRFVQIDDGLKV